jgi:ankyrin repeat protein
MLLTGVKLAHGTGGGTSMSKNWFRKDKRLPVARFLLEKGADVNAQAKDGISPLMLAAVSGQPDMVKLLLEKGAKVGLTDERGWTALSWACKWGEDVESVEALLAGGADLNQSTDKGETPLAMAKERMALKPEDKKVKEQLIKLLETKGAQE